MTSVQTRLSLAAVLILGACGGGGPGPGLDPQPDGGGRETALAVTDANSATQTVGNWQVTVTDLGLLTGGSMSSARAISNNGKVVGIATDSSFMIQRVVWDLTNNGATTTLPNYDPSSTAEPESINDLGQVSGTERISSTLSTGVFWSAAGSVFGLLPISGGSSVQMSAHQINKDGYVVGSSREGAPGYLTHPVMWFGTSAPVSLGFLGNGGGGTAFGINDARHVVGEASTGTVSRGFLWRGDKLVDLGAEGGSAASSKASAVNNLGVIVGTSDSGTIPVQWKYDPSNSSSNPSRQRLPVPSGLVWATPVAINDAGDSVGTATLSNYAGTRAVLWRGSEAINLGTWPGGRNSRAFGINGSGQIVGEGDLNGDGRNHALLWTVTASGGTPTPPPSPPPPTTTNTAPGSVRLAAIGSTSLKVGGTLQVQGSFSDPDNGPWNCTIAWGDGSTSGPCTNTGSFTASHTYPKASPKGGYKVVLTVTDSVGASGSSSTLSVRVK